MSKGEARSHLLHYYCRLCDSNCSSDLVLRQHLYGKKHRKSCISCSSSFGQIDQVFLGSNLVCDSLGSSLLPFPAEVLDCRLDDIFLETFYERCSPSERGLKRIVNVVDEILLILKPGPISSHLNTILVGSFPSKTMIRSRPTFDIVLLFGAIPSPEEVGALAYLIKNGQFCVSLRPPFGLVASKNNIWVKVLLTSSQALQRKNGLPPAHYEMLKRGLDAVRHEVWFSEHQADKISQAVTIIKGLVDWRSRRNGVDLFRSHNDIEVELALTSALEEFGTYNWLALAHWVFARAESSICLCRIVKEVFGLLASGVLLASHIKNLKIGDECEPGKFIGDQLTFQQRDLITMFAQHFLRLLLYRQLNHLFLSPGQGFAENSTGLKEEIQKLSEKQISFSALWPLF